MAEASIPFFVLLARESQFSLSAAARRCHFLAVVKKQIFLLKMKYNKEKQPYDIDAILKNLTCKAAEFVTYDEDNT